MDGRQTPAEAILNLMTLQPGERICQFWSGTNAVAPEQEFPL
jgi:hypothetical protein